ncbi:MAG: hypothetical protein HKN73_15410, partial [Gemmatimonadetes bacterium]|nr:hypothetical protein [Gemmatimonadota bacterium]
VGEGAENESSISSSAAIDEIMSHERLIVMPLENLTGEPEDDVWSMLAAEWIGNAIDRPRPIDVIPAATVRDALKVLGDSASVSAVANRVAASHAIAGTLARTGDQVRFQVELLDARTEERLRTLDPAVGSVDAVEATVGRLADDAAVAAVVLLSPTTSIDERIRSMPPSIEAYKQVVLTGDLFCENRYREAIEAGDRARELAPELVSPLFLVRIAYLLLGRVEESDSVTALLQSKRDQMTNVERLIQDHRINDSAGDLDLATRTAEELFRIMPTTVLGGYQAARIALWTRRTTEAVDRFHMVDIDGPCEREWRPWWPNLADAYHLLGRYEDELSLVRRGLERFPEYRALMDREARALAAMDREGRVDSLLVAMEALPPRSGNDPNVSAVLAGLELRAHGHHEAARRTLETAADRYATLPPGQHRHNRGLAYQHAGRWNDADTTFAALAAEEPESWAVLADHGVVLAMMGRVAEAEALSRRLMEFDVHPSRRGEVIVRRVAIAAALGEQEDAIALLQEAFAAGYRYGTQFHTDPAYVSMRDNPQWAALVAPG